jgi:hypothetical protein
MEIAIGPALGPIVGIKLLYGRKAAMGPIYPARSAESSDAQGRVQSPCRAGGFARPLHTLTAVHSLSDHQHVVSSPQRASTPPIGLSKRGFLNTHRLRAHFPVFS